MCSLRLSASQRMTSILTALLFIAACAPSAPSPAAAPTKPAQSGPAATTAPTASAAGSSATAKPTAAAATAAKPSGASEQERVAQLVEGAKKEGQVTWLGVALEESGAVAAMESGFKKKYGLPDGFKLNATRKNTGEILTTVDNEIKAGNVTVDIANVPSFPWWDAKIKAGSVMAYDSPEYAYYNAGEKLDINERPYFVSDAYTFVPVWNTRKLPDVQIRSWNDIFKYDLKGKVAIVAGNTGTSYQPVVLGLNQVVGKEFWNKLGDFSPKVFDSGAARMDATVSGEYPMNFSGSPHDVWAARKYKNVDWLKVAYPDEGIVLVPLSTGILAKAPHPNAAKLFIDYFHSKEGQDLWMEAEGFTSGRDGVKNPAPDIVKTMPEMKLIPIKYKSISNDDIKEPRAQFAKMVLKE
ncbi:MAG: extracellular solute-binding protein [Chloroflexi bacterium]|nr:extracellular solute-binding protein [Chloroflexota bacterium]